MKSTCGRFEEPGTEHMNRIERAAKRVFDLAVASAALGITWPALAALAILVRVDSPGPILFRQQRLGQNGRVFEILKFRTMWKDSSVVIGANGLVENTSADTRHTSVGRWLRLYSLDELPQLINVLRGDMSLVGPRPDLPEALSLYTEGERSKLDAKPGITGLAQVSGRNTLEPHERWRLDAEYARSATLGTDARIIGKTVWLVLRRTDVYRTNP